MPLTLCRLEPDTEVCVLELSMRGLGQIAWLCSFARPHVGVDHDVGPVHLELRRHRRARRAGQGELLDGGRAAAASASCPAGRCSNATCSREGLDVHLSPSGARSDARKTPGDAREMTTTSRARRRARPAVHRAPQRASTRSPRCTRYDVLGLPLDRRSARRRRDRAARAGAARSSPLPGGGLLINDCYNANPVSMRAALAHLAARAAGRRRVAVLGDMAELGPDGPAYHREIGGGGRRARRRRARRGRRTGARLPEGANGVAAHWVADGRRRRSPRASALRPGDVVLVKGSPRTRPRGGRRNWRR